MLALNEQNIANQTAATCFAAAAAFLNEIGTTLGVVSLHKFKSFFYANRAQLQDITATAEGLRAKIQQYKKCFVANVPSLLQHACDSVANDAGTHVHRVYIADVSLLFAVNLDANLHHYAATLFTTSV